ncbi:MAG: hypothetical protein ACKN87_11525, partial [Microcystis aeruginosa]
QLHELERFPVHHVVRRLEHGLDAKVVWEPPHERILPEVRQLHEAARNPERVLVLRVVSS